MSIQSLVVVHFLFSVLLCRISLSECSRGNASPICIEKEREALLVFKSSITEPSARLSSWVGQNCCNWAGVICNNNTSHVVKLNLSPNITDEIFLVSGVVSPSLGELKHLEYLDLSFNNFPGFVVADGLDGLYLRADTLSWLSHLSKLQYLDLTFVDLSNVSFQPLSLLPSLSELRLKSCGLAHEFLSSISSYSNLTSSLSALNVKGNHFAGQIPGAFWNLTSLTTLDMSINRLNGSLPNSLGELKNLQYLDLGSNQFEGMIPTSLCTLPSMRALELWRNKLNGSIPTCLGGVQPLLETIDLQENQLSGSIPDSFCSLPSLKTLLLGYNQLSGPIPTCIADGSPSLVEIALQENQLSGPIPSSIGKLSNLSFLLLFSNRLNGSIPDSIGQLVNLEELDLNNNSFTGVLSHTLFENLSRLEELSIESLIFNVPSNWVPPFQLKTLELTSCQVGPMFPLWLRNQNEIQVLRISNNFISGSIPLNIGDVMSYLEFLDLSNNNITGSIPDSLFEIQTLDVVDLSKNQLSGSIPKTGWNNLRLLALSNNNLSGAIPNSTCTYDIAYSGLQSLRLSNNNLYGDLPSALKTCKSLVVLDVGENNLSGSIPGWIRELSDLRYFKLRSNSFQGILIPELCGMSYLHVLDLGQNKFSGVIPHCFKNLSAMKMFVEENFFTYSSTNSITQVMKGKELE